LVSFWADQTSVIAVNRRITVENAGSRGARLRGTWDVTDTDGHVVSAVAGLWARESERILVERVRWLRPFEKLPDELTWLTLDLRRHLASDERIVDAEPGTNVSKTGPARREDAEGFLTLMSTGLAFTHASLGSTWLTRWTDVIGLRAKGILATAHVVVQTSTGRELKYNVNKQFARRVIDSGLDAMNRTADSS